MTGGVFLRFDVGKVGTSAAHLRYISRPAAVRDEKEGVLLQHLDEAQRAATFVLLRDHLYAFAWLRDYTERRQGEGGRTFYHAILGFEADMDSRVALLLVNEWLSAAFPFAQAAAFLHRDTSRLHAHLWMSARDITGKKLHLGYFKFRSLDEAWNGIYARAMGHAVDDHLAKKNETRWAQRLALPPPARADYVPERPWYHRQELRNAGHDELKNELEKGGLGGVEPAATGRDPHAKDRERGTSPGESAARQSTEAIHAAERAAECAVSATQRLREDASHLGSRETREKVEPSKDKEPGRER